jgi:hypothetical protein
VDSNNQTRFENWFNKLGQAWVDRNPSAVPPLFAKEFKYFETPFGKPYTTHGAVEKLWRDVPRTQDKVKFKSEVLAIREDTAFARWTASFYRTDKKTAASLDGIFMVQLDRANQATLFRQWWVEKNR